MTSRKILQRWIDAAFCVEAEAGAYSKVFFSCFPSGLAKSKRVDESVAARLQQQKQRKQLLFARCPASAAFASAAAGCFEE